VGLNVGYHWFNDSHQVSFCAQACRGGEKVTDDCMIYSTFLSVIYFIIAYHSLLGSWVMERGVQLTYGGAC